MRGLLYIFLEFYDCIARTININGSLLFNDLNAFSAWIFTVFWTWIAVLTHPPPGPGQYNGNFQHHSKGQI